MNADNSAPGCLTLSYAPTPGGGGGEELMGLLSGQGSLSDWLKRLRYLENYLDCGEDVSGPKHLSWDTLSVFGLFAQFPQLGSRTWKFVSPTSVGKVPQPPLQLAVLRGPGTDVLPAPRGPVRDRAPQRPLLQSE